MKRHATQCPTLETKRQLPETMLQVFYLEWEGEGNSYILPEQWKAR